MWGYNSNYDRYKEEKELYDTKYEQAGVFWCPQCHKIVPHFREHGRSVCQCGNCGMCSFG